jgi:hypothetical protein
MRPPRHALLMGVNLSLLALLAIVTFAGPAHGQRAAVRARGDYTMVAGPIQGGNTSAIWIVDAVNQEMVVLRWNDGTKSLDGLGYRDLASDARLRPGR